MSVLLPVRDAASTLFAALESLRHQTLRDIEIIAVDDGSTDGSAADLRRAAVQDPRLRVVSPGRVGLVHALQRGLMECRAPLVARMDADDVCHPDRLALQADHLAAYPELGVLGCRVAFGGSSLGYGRYVDWMNELVSHEEMALARFRESPLAHPSVMFRRGLVEQQGGYRNGDFPEDYELWLRWFDSGVRFGKLRETLLTWNDSPGRLSRSDARYAPEKFYATKAAYLARWLTQHNPRHPHIVVIGAGRITRRRVDPLRAQGIVVDAWADLDSRKVGKIYDGIPVVHHDDIPASSFVVPFVSSIGAADAIRAMLERRGFVRGTSFIEAA